MSQRESLPSESEIPRRWVIYRPPSATIAGEQWESETHVHPDLPPGDEVEVMPVSEHEAEVQGLVGSRDFWEQAAAHWRELAANYDALREAAQALVDLKDGPRDENYLRGKEPAWERLRAALGEKP